MTMGTRPPFKEKNGKTYFQKIFSAAPYAKKKKRKEKKKEPKKKRKEIKKKTRVISFLFLLILFFFFSLKTLKGFLTNKNTSSNP